MAFSNAPTNQTYKPIRIKFDGNANYRSGSLAALRDTGIVNFYYERIAQEDNKQREVSLKKRPGLRSTAMGLGKLSNTDLLRGSFYDADQNAFYWAVGNKVYRAKPDTGAVTLVTTLSTSVGLVGFCGFLTNTNVRYVVFSDSIDLWIDNYAAASCNKVVDADMPTPHQPCPIYLDGYIFLVKSNTGDIYNCDLDNPSSWTAGEFITAEMGSDYVVKLAKTKNYLVAFGYNTIEFFWDAGNASGSPMSRNDAPFRNVGYITGLAQCGDKLYFVGQASNGSISVYELEGFNLKQVSNSVVDRTLQPMTAADNAKGIASLTQDGYYIGIDGHNFYVLRTSQTTWVYDLDQKFWYEWKDSSGNALGIEGAWGMYNGDCYVAITNQTTVSQFSQVVYQDFGVNFPCTYTTEPVDADTVNMKFCSRLTVLADQMQGSGTSNITVSWSDDDFASTTDTRSINLFDDLPCTRQLGRFRSRTFRVSYSDNYPLRIKGIELNINVGNV